MGLDLLPGIPTLIGVPVIGLSLFYINRGTAIMLIEKKRQLPNDHIEEVSKLLPPDIAVKSGESELKE